MRVDVRPVDGAPGYVRTTTISEGNRVIIEFDVWGMDEGGLYYRAEFATLQEAVECVEEYIGRPLLEWEHADYPPRPPEAGTEESHRWFRDLLVQGGPTLPPRGDFQTSSDYWLQFMQGCDPAASRVDF
ncbi:hypothetical protein ETAA8_29520 [Anatilimnocola aggregata]|uniref:Uncharacterized protein n=1 Tax=Anatilimnocola aggregata TaxID=2528021 RepID=A0A517YCB6_9BACT|nr:hypothetical protein ETAA8_29520 [Anatilimnocola aggregata]